jgi:hypothetical protein
MWHQATSPTGSSIPSTAGKGKWRETRNKISPSSTSFSKSRHASSVSAGNILALNRILTTSLPEGHWFSSTIFYGPDKNSIVGDYHWLSFLKK